MHDARDAEDSRLLEANEHARLLATYYPVVVERCRVRLPDPDAYEVAHRVVERLLRELTAGKRYRVPYRVVVHMVTEWKLKEFFTRGRVELELDEGEAEAPNPFEEFEQTHDLGVMFAGLPERAREVLRLRYIEGLEIEEIAEAPLMRPRRPPQALQRLVTCGLSSSTCSAESFPGTQSCSNVYSWRYRMLGSRQDAMSSSSYRPSPMT